jgi:hypothetical protein
MTLNKRKLRKLAESWRISLTKVQERIILARFKEEPWPYEWGEQDITEQIYEIIRDYPDLGKRQGIIIPPEVEACFQRMRTKKAYP